MQPCTQLVDGQAANAADAVPAWCGRIVELLWPDVQGRSGWTELSAKGRLTCRTAWSCSTPGNST